MSLFIHVVSIAGALLVLGLWVVGAVVVHGMVCGDVGTRQANTRARDTEQRIRDIGHEAQLRIMHEALRQASRTREPGSAPFDGRGESR